MKWSEFRKNISIILVEPEHPGNIGAVARAMNNMGLVDLVLVNPIEFSKETYWMAHASEDILKNARTFSSFEEIIQLFDILYATSNRSRKEKRSVSLPDIASKIKESAQKQKIGIIFGRENKGLSNDEAFKAKSIIHIPVFNQYPSLNLAQAVMIVLYELFESNLESNAEPEIQIATTGEKEDLVRHFMSTLDAIKYYPKHKGQHWAKMELQFRNFLSINSTEAKHIRLLHKYFREIENYVKYKSGNNVK